MTLPELLTELGRRGVRLEARDGRMRFSPRTALTPEIVGRLRIFKPALLALFKGRAPAGTGIDPQALWVAVLDRLEGEPARPEDDAMKALATAHVRWIDSNDAQRLQADQSPGRRGRPGASPSEATGR